MRIRIEDWGGGLGGSGYACRLCDFVTVNKDSLVTHAGYKHALFVQFMPENIKENFIEIAKSFGEKTDLWADFDATEEVTKKSDSKAAIEAEADNQLTLASNMTNTNHCETPSLTKCLECDFQVSYSFILFIFSK